MEMVKPQQTHGVPLTEDPDDDAYPHYYGGKPSGYVHSTVVYCDEIPGLDDGTIGVQPWDERVNVDIENWGEHTDVCAALALTPEDARKLARSLLLSAGFAEKKASR